MSTASGCASKQTRHVIGSLSLSKLEVVLDFTELGRLLLGLLGFAEIPCRSFVLLSARGGNLLYGDRIIGYFVKAKLLYWKKPSSLGD